ncbi:MAG: NADP-dependent oxidoreductase [Proteobacteria bacterium]|nr:NADP-dependent oxidoreductase [Pseudomonadota bacterium]
MTANRRVFLKQRPNGMPTTADFGIEDQPLPEVGKDQVLIRVAAISMDAFIRTTLDGDGIHGTAPIGGTVMALGVGEVLTSRFAGLAPGDWVTGPTLAQTHSLMPGQIIDVSKVQPSTYVGVLGMTTGLTAHVGMIQIGKVRAGDTVVVSGAAGAVGIVACQIAKAKGARAIGIAGGPQKVAYLRNEIGLDGAVDYKNADVGAQLDVLAPNGINVYFDNVGGELLDTVLHRIAPEARVVICGAISQYQHLDDVRGPKLYLRLAERNATMGGFTVDHYPQTFAAASAELVGWMAQGKVRLPEHVINGIDGFPQALITLFTGGHTGKLLVKP